MWGEGSFHRSLVEFARVDSGAAACTDIAILGLPEHASLRVSLPDADEELICRVCGSCARILGVHR
jgi:hypothetical protein